MSTHGATTIPPSDGRSNPNPPRSALETKFREWRFSTLERSLRRPLGGSVSRFFQDALDLVNGDVAILQETITCLGSNGGLQRITELLAVDLDGSSEHITQVFTSRILPFFQAITHPNVAASGLLETPMYNIYNAIFGPFGQRTVKVFSSLANIFDLLPVEALEATSAVLVKTVDLNGAASITEGIGPVAEVLAAALFSHNGSHDERVLRSQKNVERLKRRLGIGSSIPTAQQPIFDNVKATFDIIRDPPGWLSEKGRRHNNDSENIRDISILPTSEEILSSRLEYLPPMDPSELHLPGVEGLLDRHFRLLREDTIGQLRDAIRIELQRLQNPMETQDNRGSGQQGIRTHSYPHLELSDLRCGQHNGLEFVVHFKQPKQLEKLSENERREWWERSRRLQKDTLVCIVNASGSAIFCIIADSSQRDIEKDATQTEEQKQYKKAKLQPPSETLARHPQRACVVMRPVDTDDASSKTLLWHYADCVTGRNRPHDLLVEFPGVLLPSFQPILKALQAMSESADLPFSEFLAPNTSGSLHVPPPVYAQQPGYYFDLSCIMNDGQALRLYPGAPFDVNVLRSGSKLDDAQADALVASLSRRLAAIQGPPGTGKSYTGVSITRVLLANKLRAKLGPIICICYTNHALDQILEHLHENGVTQIIRMGSRSKSEVLTPLNLRNVASRMDKTKEEKRRTWDIIRCLKEDVHDLDKIIQNISRVGSPKGLQEYLKSNHFHHFIELFGEDAEGYQRVYHDESRVIQDWLSGSSGFTSPVFSYQHRQALKDIEVLQAKSLLSMSLLERQAIHAYWLRDARDSLEDKFLAALELYHEHKKEHDRIRNELDLRCLQQANVIGITTSGLARNIDLLRRLQAKVLICEEAGEVLEAHILTALLPSVQHAILIGDHLQLRPQIQNYELQHDNPRGEQYSLDVSLFERLVQPKLSRSPHLPFSTLETQRRMHPSIAQLIREPLYPLLKDAELVKAYPDVAGMKRRLYWLDHDHHEAGSDVSDIVSTSHSNEFEVEMTASLVSHLFRQGVYQANDIAVLTPYLGQLMKIRRRLAGRFEVTLGERDVDELEKAGITMNEDERPAIVKTTLLSALKVATIDNFQGEEAKVVVISLVRCNPQNKCGFLKTSNRINVLLSRAKHGMYIIGNSRTSSHVPMWSDVTSILKRDDNIGPTLNLCCPRHQDTPIRVSSPEDFVRFSPEGGCDLRCTQRLSCGHACIQRCHSSVLHDAVKCLEACTRTKPGCQHFCPLPCGEKCHDRCHIILKDLDVTLGCGHRVTSLPCWQAQDTSTISCNVKVDRKVEACGHTVQVKCHQDVDSPKFQCCAPCGGLQTCGHQCQKPCYHCRTNNDDNGHGLCGQPCHRDFETCNHRCQKPCHGQEPCSLCTHPCDVRCSHSKCSNICSEPCAPCAEPSCASCCPHSKCSMPCAAPCDWLPCSKRCEKILECGHQCPSVCGENCPEIKYCQICAADSIKNQIVDFIEMQTYSEIDLNEDPCIFPQCKHILTLGSMDGRMELADSYNLDGHGLPLSIKSSEPFSDQLKKVPTCPSCRGSLRDICRYGRIVRRALLDEGTKRFASWAQATYIPLAEEFHAAEQLLTLAEDVFEIPNQPLKCLKGKRGVQIKDIFNATIRSGWYSSFKPLRLKLLKYLQKVRKEETPVEKVWHMVEASRRRQGKTTQEFGLDSQISLTTFHIMAESLLLRCDIAILADFLEQLDRAPAGFVDTTFSVDLTANREDCIGLINDAKTSKDLEREVEGHIFYARYCALELSRRPPGKSESLKADGEAHIEHAHGLCKRYGGSPKVDALVPEVKAVELALNGGTFMSTVSPEERLAVLAAMRKEFSGTGHWYTCANGHPFTVGECGMPMETATCPTCGETIGGRNHRPAEGVHRAEELERDFARLNV
ncbi:P-loop containing nucleoside triphosphate hydrolase protein [Mytilinidion resinicola]|uniref:P-loop containing nucleoside triphosphate hydrolase protein n=1 Tax=Mytilinidion resinicola TaxID=574789 RepID=A0A6A6YY40_9PEZI|nr:P-loop containing nucleoside triphosphate hydrolase protein [Mytilinidion resinicola]KAF2813866.1 P-loop containing nucleoside triphosphate hydrolase protein [Mytilinidion resinicola]